MMSQPASRLHQRLLDQHRDRLVVEDDAVAQQAVMAVAGEGIERHVAQDADLRHFLLDGAHGAADQIVGIERFAAGLVAQARIGIGKQREAGDRELGRALGLAHRLVDRQPLDAGHGGDRRARVVAVHHEQRPDQVVGGEHVLAHHAAHPFAAPVAAQAGRQVERRSAARARLDRRRSGLAGFDRTAEFDCHEGLRGLFLAVPGPGCYPHIARHCRA